MKFERTRAYTRHQRQRTMRRKMNIAKHAGGYTPEIAGIFEKGKVLKKVFSRRPFALFKSLFTPNFLPCMRINITNFSTTVEGFFMIFIRCLFI